MCAILADGEHEEEFEDDRLVIFDTTANYERKRGCECAESESLKNPTELREWHSLRSHEVKKALPHPAN